jgi:hypothetical protein
MLNEQELVALLRRHALVAPADALEGNGDLRIVRVDRRNQNHRIQGGGAGDLFVKQGISAGASGSMAREAAVYEWLAHPSVQARAGQSLIRCLGHDAAARVLILEALPDAEDLQAYHLRTRRLPVGLAGRLGATLAGLHAATRLEGEASARAASMEGVLAAVPWVCRLPRPEVGILREASAVNLKVLRLLQRAPLFERELTRVSSEWCAESLIHGDMKLANCLTHGAGPRRRLKLVDWEFGGLGDPRWDVASVLGSYLALWVFSIPMPSPERPDLLLSEAQFPLPGIKRTTRTFLGSYLGAAAPSAALLSAWLRATVRMTGAYLVQTAYEHAASASELTAPILTLVQLALNIFDRPERAAADLLGLDLGAQPPPSAAVEPARA